MQDRPVFDVAIHFMNGDKTVIRWSDNKPLEGDVTLIDLEPGASKVIELTAVAPPATRGGSAAAVFYTAPDALDQPIQPFITLNSCTLTGE